jgi:hypothetical protein
MTIRQIFSPSFQGQCLSLVANKSPITYALDKTLNQKTTAMRFHDLLSPQLQLLWRAINADAVTEPKNKGLSMHPVLS